jgi:hypothetical protein
MFPPGAFVDFERLTIDVSDVSLESVAGDAIPDETRL